MQGTVSKWGNSLAVRLPSHIAKSARLTEGATVDLEVEDEALIIRPARKRFRLADLLAQMDDGKRHEEVDWGKPEGDEAW